MTAVECAAGCGLCCDPVKLSWPLTDLTAWATGTYEGRPDPTTEEGWARWTDNGWTDDQRDDVALRMSDRYDRRNADFAAEHWTPIEGPARANSGYAVRVSCDVFDPHTRTCTVWAAGGQPPICSGYPRYGRDPGDPDISYGPGMEPGCTFNADVRVMLPLVAVT